MNANAVGEAAPFDTAKLDRLMDAGGIDIIVANSKHNVQYMLGGYRFSAFDFTDAIALSRYLPLVVYQKGQPDKVAYFGCPMEPYEREIGRIWAPEVDFTSQGTVDAMQSACRYIESLGGAPRSIGVEKSFLPADALEVLTGSFEGTRLSDVRYVLERLRSVKSARELAILKSASERVEEAMVQAFAEARPGMSRVELLRRLEWSEVQRDLDFQYCYSSMGQQRNPSQHLEQKLRAEDTVTLDSGGNYKGYIGDITRMGAFGTPDQQLVDLLAEVEEVQKAARDVVRAGVRGGDVIDAGRAVKARLPHGSLMEYVAHGMGMVAHEAPQLADENPHEYPGADKDHALEAGMVISIESGFFHPERGLVRLEDTVAVTPDGHEIYGKVARGWNPMGVA
jgi:Xaa-Pro dipeptidase